MESEGLNKPHPSNGNIETNPGPGPGPGPPGECNHTYHSLSHE